ncbi:type II toxin-antitoxin system PemK/MazF family toxin, partial [Synechocystis salina]
MNPGDVVFVDFPYADQASSKLRPALIIAIIPGKYNDVLIAAISSRLYQAISNFDELIKQTDDDFELTGLKIPSLIRLGKLTSVESQMISARLGNI